MISARPTQKERAPRTPAGRRSPLGLVRSQDTFAVSSTSFPSLQGVHISYKLPYRKRIKKQFRSKTMSMTCESSPARARQTTNGPGLLGPVEKWSPDPPRAPPSPKRPPSGDKHSLAPSPAPPASDLSREDEGETHLSWITTNSPRTSSCRGGRVAPPRMGKCGSRLPQGQPGCGIQCDPGATAGRTAQSQESTPPPRGVPLSSREGSPGQSR